MEGRDTKNQQQDKKDSTNQKNQQQLSKQQDKKQKNNKTMDTHQEKKQKNETSSGECTPQWGTLCIDTPKYHSSLEEARILIVNS